MNIHKYPLGFGMALATAGFAACSGVPGSRDEPVEVAPSAISGDPLSGAPASFKLLVVAPRAFVPALQPLVAFKNATNMPTFVATMEDVRSLATGPDDAANLKSTILLAQSQHGAQYVLLVGDMSFVPSRYWANERPPESTDQPQNVWYATADLYYANLYVNHDASNPVSIHGGFSSWDANGNGLYNEAYYHWCNAAGACFDPVAGEDMVSYNPDNVDGFPDVAVGRVPANCLGEVTLFVNKVIAFERDRATTGAIRFGWVADGAYPGDPEISTVVQGAGLLPPNATPPATNETFLGLNYGGANPALPAGYSSAAAQDVASLFGTANWITYMGHGSVGGWDGFGASDVGGLSNLANLPIVIAGACSTGSIGPEPPADEYQGTDGQLHKYGASGNVVTDSISGATQPAPATLVPPTVYQPESVTNRSMAAAVLFGPQGAGGVAYMGDTIVTQDAQPAEVASGLVQAYYRGTATTLGDAYLAGQRAYWTHHRTDGAFFTAARGYLPIFELSGDPSLRLTPLAPTHVDLVANGNLGHVYRQTIAATSIISSIGPWQDWGTLGSPNTLGTPAAVSSTPGRLDVIAADGSHDLWHGLVDATNPFCPGPNSPCTEKLTPLVADNSWVLSPGVAPAAVSWGPGRVDFFAVASLTASHGGTFALFQRSYDNGADSGWINRAALSPNVPISGIGAAASRAGVIDLFEVDPSSGALEHATYSESLTCSGGAVGQGTFSGWSVWPAGTTTTSTPHWTGRPAVASWAPGRLDVMMIDDQGQVWDCPGGPPEMPAGQARGWCSLWQAPSGVSFTGAPTVVSLGYNRLLVSARGNDAQPYSRLFNAGFAPGGWSASGGNATNLPLASAVW